jgi:hypothetical protein
MKGRVVLAVFLLPVFMMLFALVAEATPPGLTLKKGVCGSGCTYTESMVCSAPCSECQGGVGYPEGCLEISVGCGPFLRDSGRVYRKYETREGACYQQVWAGASCLPCQAP